jgi:putative chitinase
MITQDQLIHVIGNKPIISDIINPLNQCMDKYEINTFLRECHFLAQIIHESEIFSLTVENLNYSAIGLLKIFPTHFTSDEAKIYARNPEKIANRVYSNRMGNGDENSGDGWKFRGRGNIMITGRNEYKLLSNDLSVDFIETPELLEYSPYSIIVAGWYWNKNNLNLLADNDDIRSITHEIDGGLNGIMARERWLGLCKSVLDEIPGNQ